jgi:hypothetical protein
MGMQCRRERIAMSLVEVLVVLGIISILLSLTLPAVQYSREAARRMSCKSHLRQIGLAASHFESLNGQFPAGGWGYQWVGDPNRSPKNNEQPGGWLFSLLPYAEAHETYKLAKGLSGPARDEASGRMLQSSIAIYNCPSRRSIALSPFLGQYPLHNATKPAFAFKADYAGNGGEAPQANGGGPVSEQRLVVLAYKWPDARSANGVFFAGSQTRAAQIRDGLSNTYLVGEKYVRMQLATDPTKRDFGDDQSAFMGDDRDIRRWTDTLPVPDHPTAPDWDSFGSAHPSIWNVLLADGSVHSISYDIELKTHRALGNIKDGAAVALP